MYCPGCMEYENELQELQQELDKIQIENHVLQQQVWDQDGLINHLNVEVSVLEAQLEYHE